MGSYNVNPTTSPSDTLNKYAEYFEESNSNSMISVETFYKLLMAEMTNQDPLEPTSNTEFVSQLASFSALQTNTDSLYYNTIAYATSLAGKTVTIATQGSSKDDLNIVTGVVTGVDISDEKNIEVVVNGERYKLKNVMNVVGAGSNITGTSMGSDGAYAVSLIGKNVTVNSLTESGSSVLDMGIVDSVEIVNGEYRVVVNGYSYGLSDVVKVTNPAEDTEKPDEEPGSTETSVMEEEGK
ncbi:MAG TPA: flagellar hook capping protein [Ruminococcaceae bacterium]|nr:flagellar hook capping protein [Oscillospiraceae bacterium]